MAAVIEAIRQRDTRPWCPIRRVGPDHLSMVGRSEDGIEACVVEAVPSGSQPRPTTRWAPEKYVPVHLGGGRRAARRYQRRRSIPTASPPAASARRSYSHT